MEKRVIRNIVSTLWQLTIPQELFLPLPFTVNYFLKWPDTLFFISVLLCYFRLMECYFLADDKDVFLFPKPLFI